MDAALASLVEKWLDLDPCAETRAEIQELAKKVEAGDQALQGELKKRLGSQIKFGTAGLRGRMGAGFAYMNNLTVIQASQGLCKYLLKVNPEARQQGIIIGYDGRYHSEEFARLAAAAFLYEKVPVYLFKEMVATPLVSYGIKCLKTAAGVMVTASHNPKDDNGYKVYWANSAQIISPIDAGVTACIAENFRPWTADSSKVFEDPLWRDPMEAVVSAYYAKIVERYCYCRDSRPPSSLKICYTAMHGVGKIWSQKAFEVFGLPPFVLQPLQVDPDPEFRTVKFPNPEEQGALDLAMKTADETGCQVVIANDPDADRLAAAERTSSGKWHVFTGNEMGVLFADWVWTNFRKQHPEVPPEKCFMMASAVSSKAVEAMGKAEGFKFVEELTGFKWMGNKADKLEQQGMTFLFGYEVEIGFLIGSMNLDKDGVRAASIWGEMAHVLYGRGTTLIDHLESIYQKYGFYLMNNMYVRISSPDKPNEVYKGLRNFNGSGTYPRSFGPFHIQSVRDLDEGIDTAEPNGKAVLPKNSGGNMLTFRLTDGSWVTFRHSGTEPKFKYYVESCGKEGRDAVAAKLELLTRSIETYLLSSFFPDLFEKPKS